MNLHNNLLKSLIFTVITLFCFSGTLSAQLIIPKEVFEKNRFNSNTTFYEIQNAMNDHWRSSGVENGYKTVNGVKTKVAGWKIFKRWEYYWEQRINLKTGEFPTSNSVDEYRNYLQSSDFGATEKDMFENWTSLGSNYSDGGYAGLGRINCIALHPSDNNTFWVGSPSGGIWRTTNGGANWTILNNNEAVLGVSDIIIPSDYATSNTLYIATGDRDGGSMGSLSGGQANDNNSIGILKSTDAGATWNSTGLTFAASSGNTVTRMLIHPSNDQILFASVISGISAERGIYKSTNGGTTWVKKTGNLWIDMEFKPGDPTIIYASSEGYGDTYVNRSTNNGETWSLFVAATNGRRGELAVTPADPSVVYLISANSNSGVLGVYKSTNSGASFSVANAGSPAGILGYYTDGSGGDGGQCSYDLCIAIKPDDANTVFIGGVTTWKSTDGGVTFTANTNWTSGPPYNLSGVPEVHADKHAMVYQNSTTLFEGNDGGIYKTTDGGTSWTDLSNGLVISQIYRIGVSQTDPDIVLTGLQDNGSKKYTGAINTWFDATGGDGMECIIDYNNATTYMYATYVSGTIYRNSNGFTTQSAVTISENIPGGQPDGAWVTPYIMDPVNSAILYAGYDKIWKTTNRGNNWTSISQELSPSVHLRSLAISASNNNVMYTADRTSMWKTTDGGATDWVSVTPPVNSNYITYIAVKNNDPNTLWITYGGYSAGEKVYKSTDGGSTWSNISSGLPNIPVMCIVYDKEYTDVDVLFVGTDAGVFLKDGSLNWSDFNTGLPKVVVTELEIAYGDGMWNDKLRAGTYGRGLWETDLPGALPVELLSFVSTVDRNNVKLDWSTGSEINNAGFEIQRKSADQTWERIGNVAGSGNTNFESNYSFTDKGVRSGMYSYRLKQIDYNGDSRYYELQNEVNVGVPSAFKLGQNYPNPFNPVTTISFDIPENANVKIYLYDISGRQVANLLKENLNAGYYSMSVNASNLSSGTYFYAITANHFRSIKKMMVIK